MDKLNNYFDKAKELKLDKELIDIQNFDSIIQKKNIKKNLIKGTVTMSILTIIILGITLLLPNEKENQKDFNPETMRRLPIFHLTIEEFENLNVVNIPKTYEEYRKYNNSNKNEIVLYKQKNEYDLIPLAAELKYKFKSKIGSSGIDLHSSSPIKLSSGAVNYFFHIDLHRLTIEEKYNKFNFTEEDYFVFKPTEFVSFKNLVILSLEDKPDYISNFYIFFVPNEDLYSCLPERYKDKYIKNYKYTDDLYIDKNLLEISMNELKKKEKSKIKITIPTLELKINELNNIGISVNKTNVSFIHPEFNEFEKELMYIRYTIDEKGISLTDKEKSKPKFNTFPQVYYINRFEKTLFKTKNIGSSSVHFNVENSILNFNTFETYNENPTDGIKVKFNKDKVKNVESILNKVIPIKFKITLDDNDFFNEYIFWFEITDEFISKLPARYQKRFNKEIELYQQVLDNTKELKELCAELEEESLLGLCINESINNINLYPNPAKSNIKIELDLESKKDVLIKLFDVSGKEISSQGKSLSKGKNTIEYDVSKISSGIYIVNIFDGDVVMFSRNIIIE